MDARLRRKLRGHIARTGWYEPLVVRRHPIRAGEYEIIHGRQRAAVLGELGYEWAACLVWEMSDVEALVLLATMNGLRGKEKGKLRLGLLRAMKEAGAEDVAGLPEREETLERIWGHETAGASKLVVP